MDFDREYKKLNQAQKEAVDSIDGPLIVVAGPGTGKTQLLSMRAANILRLTDVSAENILCLTFTEAAADNMRSRLLRLIGRQANQIAVFTFHGFGTHIIQNYPDFFYDAPLVEHLNELGEYDLLEGLMNRLHHNNPLAKKVNDSFLHLPSVIRSISLFKQAGLSPSDLRIETTKTQTFFKAASKHLDKTFGGSPSPKFINLYQDLQVELAKLAKDHSSTIGLEAAAELDEAVRQIEESSRFAQPITGWRNKWLNQIRKGHWRFSDQQKNILLLQLADLYEKYQIKLTQNGLYTFDDMILRTIRALEQNEELKLTLQEKYQYILVDEYQDTNGAQDKILKELSDNPVNEAKPNLMVVGDDDQAIYRFQGANSSVMQDFISTWRPKQVVLTDSYRSGQDLLDFARGVITNADNRLEVTYPGMTKILEAKGQTKSTIISELYSATESSNYLNTALKIKGLIDSGAKPSSITVLAPKHRYLESLASDLQYLGVPVNYERREQIFQQPRIIELLDLVKLVSAVSKFNLRRIEALLPKVLAAEYWGLSANTLWEIAIKAQKTRKSWLEILEKHEDRGFRNFAEFLKAIGKLSKNQSFDLTLAYLIGTKEIGLSDGKLWESPWRNYYFSESKVGSDPSSYLKFISQFNTLQKAFRDWRPNLEQLRTIKDFEAFIDIYKKSKLRLSDNSQYSTSLDTVSLMTVYKAKGLEWDTVFVLNAEEDVWGSKTRSRNQSFTLPSSLRWIEPAIDNSNDLIRLFYVGLTRAQRKLFITSFDTKDTGQTSERLIWLDSLLPKPTLQPIPASVVIDQNEYNWRDVYGAPTKDLKALLKPIIDSYQLSPTHLIDFLAVDRGGPKHFLYRHLLRLPEELSPGALYGDSIHKTLEYIHKQLSAKAKVPSMDAIDEFFIKQLEAKPLTKSEMRFFKKRGQDNLLAWLEQNKLKFQKNDISEHDFGGERIMIGEIKLTGKVDVIRPIEDSSFAVIDYKTSSPVSGWSGLIASSAIKSFNYQKQLLFYKLLVDNSSLTSRNRAVSQGIVEFLTPDNENNYPSLTLDYNENDINRLKDLISIVWQKIITLDLPDTLAYPPTIKGIKSFENDLLNGTI